MQRMKRLVGLMIVAVLATTALVGCGAGSKEKFPTKPITIIVPWGAGGGTDMIARSLAKQAEQHLGQPVNVTNVTGGGGAVGHGEGLKANPDGYTLTLATFELVTLPIQGLTPFTYKDFNMVMRLNTDPATVTVRKDAEWKTLKDYIDYAKANPGKIKNANSGPGGAWHLAAALLEQKSGAKLTHLPFNGAAPGLVALLGKEVESSTASPAEVRQHVQAGNLRLLAISSEKRDPLFPDVPTFKEAGVDMSYAIWRGLAAPQKVSADRIKILQDAFKKAYESPEFQKFAKDTGLGLAYQPGDEFVKYLANQTSELTKVMQDLGLAKK